MKQHIAQVSLLVNDYDEAIEFYTKKLSFVLVTDTPLGETKRWVIIKPKGSTESCILLAKAVGEEQRKFIGNQTGGRVFLFLYTDDFWRDYKKMTGNKIEFTRDPKEEPYGMVAVFKDLYGNLWDLIWVRPPKKGKWFR